MQGMPWNSQGGVAAMKVEKSSNNGEPKYPSLKAFVGRKTLAGIAAIGVGMVAGGCGTRTGGDIENEWRLGGDFPVEPQYPAATSYTVQKDDTLWAIAKRFLGSGSRWEEIAKLNPDVDPKSLEVGTVLLLPAP